jgi:hypothetical protein
MLRPQPPKRQPHPPTSPLSTSPSPTSPSLLTPLFSQINAYLKSPKYSTKPNSPKNKSLKPKNPSSIQKSIRDKKNQRCNSRPLRRVYMAKSRELTGKERRRAMTRRFLNGYQRR